MPKSKIVALRNFAGKRTSKPKSATTVTALVAPVKAAAGMPRKSKMM